MLSGRALCLIRVLYPFRTPFLEQLAMRVGVTPTLFDAIPLLLRSSHRHNEFTST
jgi:hypothetical protein